MVQSSTPPPPGIPQPAMELYNYLEWKTRLFCHHGGPPLRVLSYDTYASGENYLCRGADMGE